MDDHQSNLLSDYSCYWSLFVSAHIMGNYYSTMDQSPHFMTWQLRFIRLKEVSEESSRGEMDFS